jgi:uracil-DNA glycosylase
MSVVLPVSWEAVVGDELRKEYFPKLMEFVANERRSHEVYPPEEDTFAAFALTRPEAVKVLLLGQDPYPGAGQAEGLCFSVRPHVAIPKSLQNVFRELHDDVGVPIPNNGSLVPWAREGVLLLNTVLTVRARQPNSHAGQGWETFTDAVIRAVNTSPRRVVFMLWGERAKQKIPFIDQPKHAVVAAAHPSPLAANHGFFGSKPFSRADAALVEDRQTPIDWRISDL